MYNCHWVEIVQTYIVSRNKYKKYKQHHKHIITQPIRWTDKVLIYFSNLSIK